MSRDFTGGVLTVDFMDSNPQQDAECALPCSKHCGCNEHLNDNTNVSKRILSKRLHKLFIKINKDTIINFQLI